MKKNLTQVLVLIFCMGLVGFAPIAKEEQTNSIVIIVNNENPIGDMSKGQVKLYYLRKIKKRWPATNLGIKPVEIKGSNLAKSKFLSDILGMSATDVEQYFRQRQFANAEAPPATMGNEREVINFVKENPGAIAYVSLAAYDAAKSEVKAVLTQ